MSLYYITGIAGAGKSEARKELARLGYETHEVDDGLAHFYNNSSDEIVRRPESAEDRTLEWRQNHTWKISRKQLEDLSKEAKSKPIFVCGVASNDLEMFDLFSKTFALVVDDETLGHRIRTRKTGNFGKNKHEFETIMEWQQRAEKEYRGYGSEIINGTKPINEVVKEILDKL